MLIPTFVTFIVDFGDVPKEFWLIRAAAVFNLSHFPIMGKDIVMNEEKLLI